MSWRSSPSARALARGPQGTGTQRALPGHQCLGRAYPKRSHRPPSVHKERGPVQSSPRGMCTPSLTLAPGARTVTTALRAMGWAAERRFTNDHRVLNRATWSARQGSRMLLGVRMVFLVSPGATIVWGAEDTIDRRGGRKITAKGCDREAVRSTRTPLVRGFGLQWVSLRLLVPVPWRRRVWAWSFVTALCWPAKKRRRPRHQTSVDGVRHMSTPVRRWLPGRRLVWVVDGGVAAVSLALAGVKPHVVMVSRLCWAAALYRRPGLQPPGKRGRKPAKGKRQRRVQGWAECADTPWEDVAVNWYGGQAEAGVGLLAYGPVVHSPVAACGTSLCAGGRSRGEAANGGLLLYRPAGDPRAAPGMGRQAWVGPRSPVKKPERLSAWRPNGRGRTWPWRALPPPCWRCVRG
jgi:hypothetical protein